jgi:two-component system KDP operon response regulator KdpE
MKILVIDDSQETTEFISLAFNVGWPGTDLIIAESGRAGLDLFEKESPDSVIVDIGLPDICGYDVIKDIRSFSKTPIIIITVRNSESDIVKGLEMGADDYLVKPFGQMELLARVKAVNRRSNVDISSIITYGPLSLHSLNQLDIRGKITHLTPIEARVLRLFLSHGSQLVTYEDLAECIWGASYPNSNDAIRIYIRRLRLKLGINTAYPCMIESTSGIGYSLKVPH